MGGAAPENAPEEEGYKGFNAARGFVGGAASFSGVIDGGGVGFNAARGFVGGAAKPSDLEEVVSARFQCRTRLCGWCSKNRRSQKGHMRCFNAARGFVGGAAQMW